jgi:hypothetical protein
LTYIQGSLLFYKQRFLAAEPYLDYSAFADVWLRIIPNPTNCFGALISLNY